MARVNFPYTKRQVRTRRRPGKPVWHAEYWYYRRKGAPDDGEPIDGEPGSPEFRACLDRFNARATHVPVEQVKGTFAHLVKRYKDAPEFEQLRPKTQLEYGNLLKRLSFFDPFPVTDIDRQAVRGVRDRFKETPHLANALVRTLSVVFSYARDLGEITDNPASKPRLLRVLPRDQMWSTDDEHAFFEVASPEMRLAFALSLYTAQRQGDVLALTWAQYNGKTLRLKQSKTDTFIDVPVHKALRGLLDRLPRRSSHILATAKGEPFGGDNFRHLWREATLAAKLDGLQHRDLRRTAMVRLAELGCGELEIADLSGHDIEYTRRILATYIPRKGKLAGLAIAKWEEAERKAARRSQRVGNSLPSNRETADA